MKRARLSAEFRLLLACCRWPRSGIRDAEIASLAGQRLDWALFTALVSRHRVGGLVHRALAESGMTPPAERAGRLSRQASAIAADTLRQVAESRRLAAAMNAAGIAFTFLKGATIARLAYDNLAVKQAWDIDLLVAPERVHEAAAILVDLGYRRDIPGPDLPEAAFREWIDLCKESLWTHRGGAVVELHTRLVDNPLLLPGISATSPQQEVAVAPGIALPTLEDGPLFTYLCLHGAAHGWSRLKWLADVAAFVRRDGRDAEALYRQSLTLGAGRSSAQALLLCADLLALPLPPALDTEIRRDAKTRLLARMALYAMTAGGARELDGTVFGTAPIHVSHFLMRSGLGYKLAEARRKLSNPEDRVLSPLPRWLRFMSPLLAVPRWIKRRYDMSRTGS